MCHTSSPACYVICFCSYCAYFFCYIPLLFTSFVSLFLHWFFCFALLVCIVFCFVFTYYLLLHTFCFILDFFWFGVVWFGCVSVVVLFDFGLVWVVFFAFFLAFLFLCFFEVGTEKFWEWSWVNFL